MTGFLYYFLTSLVTLFGSLFGTAFVKEASTRGQVFDGGQSPFYINWDGQWYKHIASHGYSMTYGEASNVNFFPAYPLISRALAAATGWSLDTSLLIVANVCLFAAFAVLACYYDVRDRENGLSTSRYALLALGLTPPSFFLRMGYSESLFLLLTALILFGMHNRWPLIVLAAIAGLATATRPVGVAIVPALVHHIWLRHPKSQAFAARCLGLMPVATWGLIAYMIYLGLSFGDPLAFFRSHASWNKYSTASALDRIMAILTFQPFWSRFVPSSAAYWVIHEQHNMPLFSLYLADPFYFFGTIVLVGVGARHRWLTASESLMAVGLLAMPLIFKYYETNMLGFGRYAIAALPVYLVIGRIMQRIPGPLAAASLVVSACFMLTYAALFAKWYILI